VRTRLAEVGAYAGAGLVVAAAGLIVAQTWADLPRASHIALLGAITVLLLAAGLAVGGFVTTLPTDRRAVLQTEPGAIRRRLSSTLLVGGACSAAGAVGVWLDAEGDLGVDRGWPPTAATALTLAAVGWWLTGTVLAELAMGVGMLMTLISLGSYVRLDDPWPSVTLFVVGLAWTSAALLSLLRHRTISAGAGLLVAYVAAMSASISRADLPATYWPAYLLLGLLAALCLTVYVREQEWTLVGVGLLSLMSLVLRGIGEMAGGVLGRAIAVLLTGVVLLAGAWLVWRRRRPGDASAADGPGWVLSDVAYRSAFAADPVPHAILNEAGTLIDGNAAMATTLHVPLESLRGRPLGAFLAEHPDDATRVVLFDGRTLVSLTGAARSGPAHQGSAR
jgi:PAS domain-containing protein